MAADYMLVEISNQRSTKPASSFGGTCLVLEERETLLIIPGYLCDFVMSDTLRTMVCIHKLSFPSSFALFSFFYL